MRFLSLSVARLFAKYCTRSGQCSRTEGFIDSSWHLWHRRAINVNSPVNTIFSTLELVLWSQSHEVLSMAVQIGRLLWPSTLHCGKVLDGPIRGRS